MEFRRKTFASLSKLRHSSRIGVPGFNLMSDLGKEGC